MDKNKKIQLIKDYSITLVISLVIGTIIFCLYFFLNGRTLTAACSATFLAGVILICTGLLITVARYGAFDTFAYGFKQLGTTIFRNQPTKYNDMAEYKQECYEKRKTKTKYFLFVILAGLLYCIAGGILEIIFHSIYGA